MIFKNTPAFTMSFTFTYPLENTMALGGVAIGSIKAQLDAIVTGIKTYNNGISNPIVTPATTGAKTATSATLLINSVIKSMRIINRETMANTLRPS